MAIDHYKELQPLTLIPNSLTFGNLPQKSSKTLQVVISNPYKQSVLWHSSTCGTEWLNLDPPRGSLLTGQQETVNIKVDTSSLAIGNYTATLIFTSEEEPSSASIQLPVSLTVLYSDKNPEAVQSLAISPFALGLNFARYLNSSKTIPLAISNQDGQNQVKWTAVTGASWLTIDRYEGTLEAHEQQTIFVTASTSSLPLGDYAATLTVTTDLVGHNVASGQIQAKLHVGPQPFSDSGPKAPTSVIPSRFDFNTQITNGKLVFINSIENPLVDWTIDSGIGINWVTLNPSAGNRLQGGGLQTVKVAVDESLLPHQAGNHKTDLTITLTFSDQNRYGSGSTSVLVPVTMTLP